MGHQTSRNQSQTSNYPSGDSSGGQTYLSLLPRAISSGIISVGKYASVFFGAFIVALLSASSLTPVDNSSAQTDVNTVIRATGTYARITAPAVMELNLESTASGAAVTGSHVVTTATNAEHGYKLFVSTGSTNVDSQKMVKSGETNAISQGYYLSPISGTSVLSSAPANSWGYAMPNQNGNGSEITTASTFVEMPLRGSDNLIRTETDATSDASGNITDETKANTTIYYGAKANTGLPSGTYTATVTYTAIIESNTDTISVVPYAIPQLSAGYNVTVATPIAAEQGMDIGTPTITVRPAGATSGGTTVNCTRKVVDDSIFVTLSCPLPAENYVGEYDVIASVNGSSYTASNAILHYVPWDKLQYMQDMTTYACDKIETPKAYNNGGTSAVYNYGPISSSSNTIKTDNTLDLTNDWTTYSTASYASYGRIANINTGVPEKNLIDVRDGNSYRVRKLADGNCWMTENLRLAFNTNGVIANVNGTTVSNNAGGTYPRTGYGPSIVISGSHAIDENYSNVGKNAVGGTSQWTTATNNTFVKSEYYYSNDNTNKTVWGGSGADNDAKNVISMNYSRSLYNGITRGDCTKPGDIANTGSNDCFIRDNDTQTIGTYYNWRAATAGTGVVGDENVDKKDSICPSGWQLPTATGSKSYGHLLEEVYSSLADLGLSNIGNIDARNNSGNSDTGTSGYKAALEGYHVWAVTAQMRMAPLSLPFSGSLYFTNGGVLNIGYEGFWWSSTATSSQYARDLVAYAGLLRPLDNYYKGGGFAVRCVSQ